MRLFVAVHLPDEVRAGLAAVQQRLRTVGADASWVRPENMHLTLKFLGEVEPARLAGIRAALAAAAPGAVPFEAVVAGVGSFGGRIPRVVWAAVSDGAEPLAALADRVDAAMAAAGFPRERRAFTPHLTLGRVRSPRRAADLLEALRGEERGVFGPVPVHAVFLMESQLNPQGSIYTILDRFPLGAG